VSLFSFSAGVIESSFPLELEVVTGEKATNHFFLETSPNSIEIKKFELIRDVYLHGESPTQNSPWLSIYKSAEHFLCRFYGMSDFCLSLDGREIVGYPVKDLPAETIRHLLVHQVLPLAFTLSEDLVLHGSAVSTPQGALVFLGESGEGKSTLASYLAANGFPLLTDDCLVVRKIGDEFVGYRGSGELRLWEDSTEIHSFKEQSVRSSAHYTEKKRIVSHDTFENYSEKSQAIARIFVLDSAKDSNLSGVSTTPLSAREACIALVHSSFRLDTSDSPRASREFEQLTQLSKTLSFDRLSYPHDFTCLPQVHDEIVKGLSK